MLQKTRSQTNSLPSSVAQPGWWPASPALLQGLGPPQRSLSQHRACEEGQLITECQGTGAADPAWQVTVCMALTRGLEAPSPTTKDKGILEDWLGKGNSWTHEVGTTVWTEGAQECGLVLLGCQGCVTRGFSAKTLASWKAGAQEQAGADGGRVRAHQCPRRRDLEI